MTALRDARRAVPIGLAVVSGVALLLAHPPAGLWWTSFLHAPALVAALWIAEGTDGPGWSRRPSMLGALSGIACFGPMLAWIVAPAGFVGWGLLVAMQAGWMALLAVVVSRFLEHRWLPVVAAVVWTGIDAWRGIAPFNGFEWGAIAYAHVEGSWLLPVARVVGGRGITLLVVAIGVSVAVLVRSVVSAARSGGGAATAFDPRRSEVATLLGALLLSAVVVAEPPSTVGSIDVLVAQGNDIRHWEDPAEDAPLEIVTALRDETLAAIGDGPRPDVVVWPESAVDRDPDSALGASLAPFVDETAAAAGELLAGTTLDGPDPRTQRYVAASRYVDGLEEVDRYVKRRLVPFGEYVPLRPLLDWFPPLEQVPRDAIPGPGPDVMELGDGTRVAIVICFETLFTSLVRSNVLAGEEPAQVVMTLTNDASFRDTAEAAQHLAQSRLRAVETGRWMVHAALSGSSAFVDPEGGVHQETPVFTRTTIRRDVPLVEAPTPYLRTGDVLGVVARALVMLWVLWGLVDRWRR